MTATPSEACALAHNLLRRSHLNSFPFEARVIPHNGLYVLYEKGEFGHGGARIVRVGTHTGQNQLRARLSQHFLQEKKDRSIFRKNIGRCLLAQRGDPYCNVWECDLTTRAARLAPPSEFDPQRQAVIEKEVSEYIRNSFTFVVLEVPEKEERLRIESGLVSLVSRCSDCRPSTGWLGLWSPKERIRNSGLWQVNELYKTPLGPDEVMSLIG